MSQRHPSPAALALAVLLVGACAEPGPPKPPGGTATTAPASTSTVPATTAAVPTSEPVPVSLAVTGAITCDGSLVGAWAVAGPAGATATVTVRFATVGSDPSFGPLILQRTTSVPATGPLAYETGESPVGSDFELRGAAELDRGDSVGVVAPVSEPASCP